jgi:hypothetical protein
MAPTYRLLVTSFAMRRRAATLVVCAIAAAGAAATSAAQDRTTPPDPLTQPLQDGCQRTALGLLTYTSAHWSFVYRDNPGQEYVRPAEGVVRDAHVAAGDLPQGHDSYDLNFELALDPGYRFLEPAGDAIHTEREQGHTAVFAWPTDGDRVKVWGNWVWDCGHWGPQPVPPKKPEDRDFYIPGGSQPPVDNGTDVRGGESTELHPFSALVSRRARPYLPQVEETQTDVYISSNGTLAHAEARCAKENAVPAEANRTYGPNFTACVNSPASQRNPVNTRDYTFFIPAPPRPSPSARLRYRVLTSPGHGRAPMEQVIERGDGIEVTIPFKGFGSADEDQAYAKSFFVGWDGGLQRLPARLELTLHKIKVINSLDGPNRNAIGGDTSSGVPPGEYGLTMDVNGFWKLLNDWAPGLGAVNDNQELSVERTIGLNVADGDPVQIKVHARECDLPKINPCPQTPEVAEDNDNPGTLAATFASSAAAVGDHVLKNGNWEMTYSIREISPARVAPVEDAPPAGGPTGGPGGRPTDDGAGGSLPNSGPAGTGQGSSRGPGGKPGGCPDTYAPSSRIRGHRAGRRSVGLHGRASDRTCRGAGSVRAIYVAIARREGRLCRFLSGNGRLGRRVSCSRRAYLRARGTTSWRLNRRVRLPPGRYIAWSRAVDAAGNVERSSRTDNFVRFRVR